MDEERLPIEKPLISLLLHAFAGQNNLNQWDHERMDQ